MDASERRRWERLERELRVRLHVIEPGPSRTLDATATHLSPEGMFLQVPAPPPQGARVQVSIDGAEHAVLLSVEGTVSNQLPPTDASTVTGIGIALDDPGPAWRKVYDMLSIQPKPNA